MVAISVMPFTTEQKRTKRGGTNKIEFATEVAHSGRRWNATKVCSEARGKCVRENCFSMENLY